MMARIEQIREKWTQLKQTDSLLWLITLGHTFTHWCPATFYLLLPFLQEELDLSYSQVGLIITVRSVVNLFINIPSGMIVDLIGRRGLMMGVALAATGLPYLLVGVSQTYFWVVFFMAFVGMGNYLWHPAAISTLSDKYPQRRGFAIAIHALGPNIGESLAPFIVGLLLLSFSWRNVLFLNLLPGLVITAILWKYLFGSPEIQSEKKKEVSFASYLSGIRTMARNPSLMSLVLVAGMRSMTQSGLHTFLPIYLTHHLGFSSALTGFYISVAQSAGMISTPFAGSISDRSGRKRVIAGGLFSTSLVLIVLAYFQVTTLFIAILALLGFFLYAIRPVIWAWVFDLSPKEFGGTTVSFFSASQSLLGSLSPILCGFIADRWGILAAFYFLAGTVLTANLIVLAIPEARKEPGTAVEKAGEASLSSK